MQLGMSLRLVQIQLCTICDQNVNDHAPSCPCTAAKIWENKRLSIHCPCCKKRGGIDVNTDDFYECRQCNTQFTRMDAYDDDNERILLIDWNNDKVIACYRLPYKGRGQIQVDIKLKEIGEKIKLARKEARARKKK